MNTKFKESLIYSLCAYRKTKREINKKIKILKNPTIKKEIKEINQSQLFKESKPYLKKKKNKLKLWWNCWIRCLSTLLNQ